MKTDLNEHVNLAHDCAPCVDGAEHELDDPDVASVRRCLNCSAKWQPYSDVIVKVLFHKYFHGQRGKGLES